VPLSQGVTSITRKPFGSVRGYTMACWDAKRMEHLPLPRAVGPYTVVRTTKRFNTTAVAMQFGTFQVLSSDGMKWTDTVALGDGNVSFAINEPLNCYSRGVRLQPGSTGFTCVPSAISVNIINPNALQTTNGVVYAGILNVQAPFNNESVTWQQKWEEMIEYQSPRLMSAGKLALRGVQMDSYPLNMSALSDFLPLLPVGDGTITYNSTAPHSKGFAPMFVYNPNGIPLEYLITVEWRVRFDLSNPASGSHSHHPIASDSQWDSMMKRAVSLGHGVKDMVETIASIGTTVRGAQALMM
jgi:hypothetical protein